MWCHLWLSNIIPCLLHGDDSAASVDKKKPLISSEVHKAPQNRHSLSCCFTLSTGPESHYLHWAQLSAPAQAAATALLPPTPPARWGLGSATTDLTQQVPLTSAKTHLNHSKTAQKSKSTYITAFQMMNTKKRKRLTPILLLMRVSIQHPLIFLRFFTIELAIASTVSMGLWEAVAAHFHHHPTHTKYVTRYLTTQAATSVTCAQLSEGHCGQRTLQERSTGLALFRIPHKGRSMLSPRPGEPHRAPLLCRGVEQQQQQQEYFPFRDHNRNTGSVLFFSLRTACVKNPFITH